MQKNLSAIVIGLGHHGRSIARLAHEAGISVVAGVDPVAAGEPLGSVLGDDAVSAPILASHAELPSELVDRADVVVVAARLEMQEAVDLIAGYLRGGTNVVTIIEQLFDPSSLEVAQLAQLEDAAAAGGVSYLATGAQDVMWLGLVALATGGVRNLREVRITQRLGVDGYPVPFVQGEVGAGIRPEDFGPISAAALELPSVLGSVLPVLARGLGLAQLGFVRTYDPVLVDAPLQSASLGREIPVGESIGCLDRSVLTTAEGVTLTAELETTARQPGGANDVFEAVIDAEPGITLTHIMDPGPACVDATVVNRLRQVVEADPGVLTPLELPLVVHRAQA